MALMPWQHEFAGVLRLHKKACAVFNCPNGMGLAQAKASKNDIGA